MNISPGRTNEQTLLDKHLELCLSNLVLFSPYKHVFDKHEDDKHLLLLTKMFLNSLENTDEQNRCGGQTYKHL